MKQRSQYWRSLDELSALPEFERWLHAEFPEGLSENATEMHRRDFLRLMGASVTLAGFGACTKQPIEKIVPYVKQPEEIIPGKPLQFATATTFGGYAQGIIVTSHEGRPTKIEGNPDHPASLGATTIWAQADILDLYDPDRAQAVVKNGEISTWDNFLQELNLELVRQQSVAGAGLRFLTPTIQSPTLEAQVASLLRKFPQAKWHSWDPFARDSLGKEPIYDFDKARVIVALDSDFLYLHAGGARACACFRRRSTRDRQSTTPNESLLRRGAHTDRYRFKRRRSFSNQRARCCKVGASARLAPRRRRRRIDFGPRGNLGGCGSARFAEEPRRERHHRRRNPAARSARACSAYEQRTWKRRRNRAAAAGQGCWQSTRISARVS